MNTVLFRARNNKSIYLFMTIGTIVCLFLLGALIATSFYILRYEAERFEKPDKVNTEIPVLNKDGLNYFISRQAQRGKNP